MLTLVMFNTNDFLYDPIPSNIQAGIADTDSVPIQLATTQNDGMQLITFVIFRICG